MTYQEKLKDPRWQKKRLEVLERDNWCCKNCGDYESTLHVHHKVYEKNKAPWDYENVMLESLCEDCHKKEHSTAYPANQRLIQSIRRNFSTDDIIAISLGFHEAELIRGPEFTSSLIFWILTNNEVQQELGDMYLRSLGQKRKSRQLKDGIL